MNNTFFCIFLIILIIVMIYYIYNRFIKKQEYETIESFDDNIALHTKIPINNNNNEKKTQKQNNNEVYLDISLNNQKERVIIKLFDDIVPKTANNFRELCKTKKYVGTPFHRIIKNFMVQSGDFTNKDGTGGYSIYGDRFDDENFELKHTKPGLLSMANAGPNTNGSQFFITTVETPHLDDKHTVFGEVISNMNFIYKLENEKTDANDKPLNNCIIDDCGLL